MVTQNWRDIVQSCDLDNWKEALAALLTYAHPEDFACLCGESFSHVSADYSCWDLPLLHCSPCFIYSVDNLTHVLPLTIFLSFSSADILGGRLENEKTEKCCLQACLCYICSGNIERLVECWTSHRDSSSPLGLEVYSFSRLDKALNQLIMLLLQFKAKPLLIGSISKHLLGFP